MGLFFFNNGEARELIQKNKTRDVQKNLAIKRIDLSSSAHTLKKPSVDSGKAPQRDYFQTAIKKALVASPGQRESYVSASAIDSLENRRRLKASHVMSTPAVTVTPQSLVKQAQQLMQDNDIAHIVVVDAQKKPLGLITSTEVMHVEYPESSFIQNILDPSVLAVSSETLVRDIALTFMKYKPTAIAVVNEQQQLIGIVCRSDLMSLLVSSPTQQIRV